MIRLIKMSVYLSDTGISQDLHRMLAGSMKDCSYMAKMKYLEVTDLEIRKWLRNHGMPSEAAEMENIHRNTMATASSSHRGNRRSGMEHSPTPQTDSGTVSRSL